MAKMHIKDLNMDLTSEEILELEAAEHKSPIFDEDSPEMTPEMLLQFKRVNSTNRTKQTVSLRLSPNTLKLAKAYGKGYTSFLSRLLDEAIRDESLIKKCM